MESWVVNVEYWIPDCFGDLSDRNGILRLLIDAESPEEAIIIAGEKCGVEVWEIADRLSFLEGRAKMFVRSVERDPEAYIERHSRPLFQLPPTVPKIVIRKEYLDHVYGKLEEVFINVDKLPQYVISNDLKELW